MTGDQIICELMTLSQGNDSYAAFSKRIGGSNLPVLGVRVPDLRKLAKRLSKETAVDDIAKLLVINQPSFDYILLCGLLITNVKMSDEQAICLTKQWLPLTDSWAHIDTFVETNSRFASHIWWDFAQKCLESEVEFTVRYGIISLMRNFLDDQHINEVLNLLADVKHDGYYVKMALAWTYATAAVNYFEQTLAELENSNLDSWTRTKAYQKMSESRRFNSEQRAIIAQKRRRF